MAKRQSWENSLLGMLGTTTLNIGLLAATTGISTESMGGNSVQLYTDMSASVSATPDGAMAGTCIGSSASTVGGTTTSVSDGGPDAVVEVFFRNCVPYMLIERRAEHVYEALHRERTSKPVLIADTKKGVEIIQRTLGNNPENIKNSLEIYERILDTIYD